MPSPVASNAAATDIGATLSAWRARGDHRHDPVGFRFIEALARRAEAHDGEVRRILDDRLAALLAAYGEKRNESPGANPPPASARPEAPLPRSALAELVDHIARHAPLHAGDGQAASAPVPGNAPELKTLTYFRSTWSRLSADRLLTQSRKKVPQNAGPLNSQHLVHQSLTLMRELSPAYLSRFMAYVDALAWMDQANGSGASAAADAPRAAGDRKSARGKAG